jgi:predicted DNA binding protein
VHAARIALEIPADHLHPMHRFVCESPAVDRETILERDATGDVTTLLLHVAGDRERYEETIDDVPQVEEWTTTAAEDGFYVYVRTQLRTREQEYRQALDRDAVLVVPPVELRSDRTVRQTMVGRSDALSAAVEALPAAVGVDVLWTGAYDRSHEPAVSDRQREALAAAWDAGYYEVPREGGIEAVADDLGCSSSTASDLLRRAERRVVAAVLDERA